jgi:hypothetical protein
MVHIFKCVQVDCCHKKIFIHVSVSSSSLNMAFNFVIAIMHYSHIHGTTSRNIHMMSSKKNKLKNIFTVRFIQSCFKVLSSIQTVFWTVLYSSISTFGPTVNISWGIQIFVKCT